MAKRVIIWFQDGQSFAFQSISDFKVEKGLISFRHNDFGMPQIAVFNENRVTGYSYIDDTVVEEEVDSN